MFILQYLHGFVQAAVLHIKKPDPADRTGLKNAVSDHRFTETEDDHDIF